LAPLIEPLEASEVRSVIITFVVMAVMAGLLVPCRLHLEKLQSETAGDFFVFLPNGKPMRYMAAGYQSVLADYYWLKGIAYIQFGLERGGRLGRMPELYDLIVELDPEWVAVYYWGALFNSALAREPGESIALLEKGMERVPESWRIPYRLGEIYLVDMGDIEKGREYMLMAAELPNAPEFVEKFAAGLGDATERYARKALEWIEAWDRAKTQVERATARNRILATLRWCNRDVLALVVKAYEKAYGRPPVIIAQLLESGELSVDPKTGKLVVRFNR